MGRSTYYEYVVSFYFKPKVNQYFGHIFEQYKGLWYLNIIWIFGSIIFEFSPPPFLLKCHQIDTTHFNSLRPMQSRIVFIFLWQCRLGFLSQSQVFQPPHWYMSPNKPCLCVCLYTLFKFASQSASVLFFFRYFLQ